MFGVTSGEHLGGETTMKPTSLAPVRAMMVQQDHPFYGVN